METTRMELKPGATVRIVSVGGDLRLTGCDARRLEAKAGRGGGLCGGAALLLRRGGGA